MGAGKVLAAVGAAMVMASGATAHGHHHRHGHHGGVLGSLLGSAAPVSGSAAHNRNIGRHLAASYGWGDGPQWGCLDALWTHESGWRIVSNYEGSGAFGIPQALPGSKMASAGADWATNPATQIRWGLGYIRGRWGTPCHIWGEYCTATPDHPEYLNGQPLGCWY
jgi:hypothetical protein